MVLLYKAPVHQATVAREVKGQPHTQVRWVPDNRPALGPMDQLSDFWRGLQGQNPFSGRVFDRTRNCSVDTVGCGCGLEQGLPGVLVQLLKENTITVNELEKLAFFAPSFSTYLHF